MGAVTPSTIAKRVLKLVVPGPVRRLGWRSYYHARDNWLKTIVGCQTNRKVVALTFDDGPSSDTRTILEILARYQIKATFFFLGRNIVFHPDPARQAALAGHAIGNHTFSHVCLVGLSPFTVARELARCQQAIREVIAVAPTTRVMRPPFGAQDPTAYLTARIMGYLVVNWSVSGEDWQGDSAAIVAQRILTKIQPGSIILLHDGWEPAHDHKEWRPEHDLFKNRSATIQVLPTIINMLQGTGYEFVTLPEMIRLGTVSSQSWFA